jgi:hypothetical protein
MYPPHQELRGIWANRDGAPLDLGDNQEAVLERRWAAGIHFRRPARCGRCRLEPHQKRFGHGDYYI